MKRIPRYAFSALLLAGAPAHTQPKEEPPMTQPTGAARVEENVVFGMHSGLALLMDVHYSVQPNGYGVLYVPGSAWHAPLEYGASQLKDLNTGFEMADRFNRMMVEPLVAAGYTVFIINHRAAPRFRYPAAVEDAQRAVRFIRHHAARFGIDPQRLGGAGYSSGGYLVAMLGLLDGARPDAADLVERESARLASVVAGATPADLTDLRGPFLVPGVVSFLGVLTMFTPPHSQEFRLALEASPLHRVAKVDTAFLLVHGDKDEIIPFHHSERLADKLKEAGGTVELLRIPGGTHVNTHPPGAPDFLAAMVRWFDRTLRGQ
jgi:acetyl esterase/lipase